MQPSSSSARSRGILALASNTAECDYQTIAARTMHLASHRLGLPCTVIDPKVHSNNQRYSVDHGKFVPWKNHGRYLAYDLSPYDETLVLDVDYIVMSTDVLGIFEGLTSYRIAQRQSCIDATLDHNMNAHGLRTRWATVFAFVRSPRSAAFFDLVRRIQENYDHYCSIFGSNDRTFRNDHAFAMADIILNGYAQTSTPQTWSFTAVTKPLLSLARQGDCVIARQADQAYVLGSTDLHVLCKDYLQSRGFLEFIRAEIQ